MAQPSQGQRLSSAFGQVRQMRAAEVDAYAGIYFRIAAIFSVLRILWIIAQTSTVFGDPPVQLIVDIEKYLGMALAAYAIAGAVMFAIAVYFRMQSEGNEPISRLITNYAGAVLFIIVASRVSSVVQDEPLPFNIWMGLLQTGLIRGGIYALIALGYTLVYGILFMINFAHGEVMMFGAYGGWLGLMYMLDGGERSFEAGAATIAVWLVPLVVAVLFLPLEDIAARFRKRTAAEDVVAAPRWRITMLSLPVRVLLGLAVGYGALQALGNNAPHIFELVITIVGLLFVLVVGMLTSILLVVVLERIAYRPLRNAPRLTPLISAIGASIFLQQVALRVFGPIPRVYRAPRLLSDPVTIDLELGRFGVVPISKVGLVMTLLALGLMALLYFIVRRTKFGRAMRAVAEDKNTAALMGANVDRVIVITFILGAALAGATGVMLGFRGEQVKPLFGFSYGLKAFTSAVVGGIGNIPGAVVGGFFLGLIEALGPTALGFNTSWQNVIAFGLLVLVIIFRPTGLLGEVVAEKKV
jgi:branched-chain amino acid transport system permease protein